MGQLLINNFNIKNISLVHFKSYYMLNYVVDYMKLSTIPIKLKGISIINELNGYYIILTDIESINLLKYIDTYLSSYIPNYKPLLKYNNKHYYFFLKKNIYINSIIKKINSNEIIINIIKIKICASHAYPIVYIYNI